MIAKLLLQNTITTAGMGALLFACAGTMHWPSAWVFLATCALLGPLCGWWLYRVDPALLAERLRPVLQRDQPAADKAFMIVFVIAMLAWLAAMGLDRRTQFSDMPVALQALGLMLFVLSTLFILWVFRENSFAAPVVKLQADRAQRVVSTGPYAHVRHPMYSGMILFFAGVPLLLGSWWGLVMAPVIVVLFAVRIGIEERTLREGLPGYSNYMTRVRYRLLPGVW
ncbi:protein-S-isoprenylcysteine O-methyltransferase Ste14 [Bradyrhizobium japonicum]|jgi:protein-S-isoprenylcysteine O-methyltransferase Ste14|uniref:methyltransferase family protein n=1 Tax=Bradyrhizobium TaxID=374 RepID=UPI000419AB2E|nr:MULTISPECIES: isoprenylcysteine carboxylmethyltransferase family protein [Bradyrhizobium]MBR0880014.1 isoprenylcysteine carboxylmethyltransferase family protein [Bradyrhizobium liaoningense]MBR0944122.1 isoprenylcysteine carboxylmethyltransferase family protein [Bradyrhizobium liaoningense]MBR1001244.1 isoprenylcysteine carboxylmethyltransferase family protein [Bradyrhizobium liaoningense]MBR1028736.1 isoprenylcysteine carboxylmethyltransferase family protein [Bradyrhizobium liaoningense]MB